MKNTRSAAVFVAVFICGLFVGGVVMYAAYAPRVVPAAPSTSVASKTSAVPSGTAKVPAAAPIDISHQGLVSKVDASGVTIVFPDVTQADGTQASVTVPTGDTSVTFTATIPNVTSGSVSTALPAGATPPPAQQATPPAGGTTSAGTVPQPLAAPTDPYKTITIAEGDLKVNDVVEVGLKSTTGDITGSTVTSVKWIGAMIQDGSNNGGVPVISTQDRFSKK